MLANNPNSICNCGDGNHGSFSFTFALGGPCIISVCQNRAKEHCKNRHAQSWGIHIIGSLKFEFHENFEIFDCNSGNGNHSSCSCNPNSRMVICWKWRESLVIDWRGLTCPILGRSVIGVCKSEFSRKLFLFFENCFIRVIIPVASNR